MSISFPESEAELIEQRTDNISQYIRTRMRAGDLVLRAAGNSRRQLDVDKFTDIILGDDPRGASTSSEECPTTLQSDLSDQILQNLPPKDETENSDVDVDTLQELVFGTREEQKARLEETLDELYTQDRVTNDLNNNLYRTD